jgi:hypothetical protein
MRRPVDGRGALSIEEPEDGIRGRELGPWVGLDALLDEEASDDVRFPSLSPPCSVMTPLGQTQPHGG